MSRLIIVPQYPTRLRYQEWWWEEFPKHYSQYFNEVLLLGKDLVSDHSFFGTNGTFAPTEQSIQFDAELIKEYTQLELRRDDILLLNDISFPGIFPSVLFHKRPNKCFAICHATSKNRYDVFSPIRDIKYPIEKSTAMLFNGVFVATNYHAQKLNWKNIYVTPLPFPPFYGKQNIKEYNIVSVARPSKQKVDKSLESLIEAMFTTKIRRPIGITWEDYYTFLSKSKVLLVTSKEETYGYQIVDAIMNGCIPIAPCSYSYPELLPKEYLYNGVNDLIVKVGKALHGELEIPKLLIQEEANNFYDSTSKIMLYE